MKNKNNHNSRRILYILSYLLIFSATLFFIHSCTQDIEESSQKNVELKNESDLRKSFDLNGNVLEGQDVSLKVSQDTLILNNFKFSKDTLNLKLKSNSKYEIAKSDQKKAVSFVKHLKLSIKDFTLEKVGKYQVYKYKYKITVKDEDGETYTYTCKVKMKVKSKEDKFFYFLKAEEDYGCISFEAKTRIAYVVYTAEVIDKETNNRVGDVYKSDIQDFDVYKNNVSKRFCDGIDKGKTYTLKIKAEEYDSYEKDNILETAEKSIDIKMSKTKVDKNLDDMADIEAEYGKGSECIEISIRSKEDNLFYEIRLVDENDNKVGKVYKTKLWHYSMYEYSKYYYQYCDDLEYDKTYKVKVKIYKYDSPDKDELLDTKQKVIEVNTPAKEDDFLFSDVMLLVPYYNDGQIYVYARTYNNVDYELSISDENGDKLEVYWNTMLSSNSDKVVKSKSKRWSIIRTYHTDLYKDLDENKTYKVKVKATKKDNSDREVGTRDVSIDVYTKENKLSDFTNQAYYIDANKCINFSIIGFYHYKNFEVQLIDKATDNVVKEYEYKAYNSFWKKKYKNYKFCNLDKGKYKIKVLASNLRYFVGGYKENIDDVVGDYEENIDDVVIDDIEIK